MLTKSDLKAIDTLLDNKLDQKLDLKLKPIKKDLKSIKKDLRSIINIVSHEYSHMHKRTKRIEDHLNLPPISD